MMRLFLFALLMANVVMLLVLQSFRPSGLEPERLALQQHAERVTVQAPGKASLPAEAASAASPAGSSGATPPADARGAAVPAATAPAATVPAATVPAATVPAAQASATPKRAAGKCIEAGDFSGQSAARFESALPQLALPVLPVKRIVQASPSQIVMLPPQASEAAASRRVTQLREQGFKDVSVIRDSSARRWGISLGVFSKSELADAQLAALRQAGVTDARIEEHPLNASRLAYQLVGLDDAAVEGLKKLLSGFAGTALRDCP